MSSVAPTQGPCACRCAWGAETVLRTLATQTPDASDLHWGLHEVAEAAARAVDQAMDSADPEVMEAVSCRYARALAIVAHVSREAEHERLLAAEALMEATKRAIEDELDRLVGKAVTV